MFEIPDPEVSGEGLSSESLTRRGTPKKIKKMLLLITDAAYKRLLYFDIWNF